MSCWRRLRPALSPPQCKRCTWTCVAVARDHCRRAMTATATLDSCLFHGMSPQSDIFVKRRPVMEGVLRAHFNSAIEITVVHGVTGTSAESVSDALDREAGKLQVRAARSDPGTSLMQLLRKSLASCDDTSAYSVTELLEELDCTARLELGGPHAAEELVGYSGAVYCLSAWDADLKERCICTIGRGVHDTLDGLVSALADALHTHLLQRRGDHVRAAVREVQARLRETDNLRVVDPVFAATIPLSRVPRSSRAVCSDRRSHLRVSTLHHQPTSQPLCARFEVRDVQGTHSVTAVPLLAVRSRRDYIYTPHAPHPSLTAARMVTLVDEGLRDGTVVKDKWEHTPYKEVIWWSYALIARASPLYAFAFRCTATPHAAVDRRRAAGCAATGPFAHAPLSLEALVASEGRVNAVAWREAEQRLREGTASQAGATSSSPSSSSSFAAPSLTVSLTRLNEPRSLAVKGNHALHAYLWEEIGWRHAPMVQLCSVDTAGDPFLLAFPSVLAKHARGGSCHTLGSVFASVKLALETLFASSFVSQKARGETRSSSPAVPRCLPSEILETADERGEEQPPPSLPTADTVSVRVPSLDAALRVRGVVRVVYMNDTLFCWNAPGECVLTFQKVNTLRGYTALLEWAAKSARDRGRQPDTGLTPMRTVHITLDTQNPRTQLMRLLVGVMSPEVSDAAETGKEEANRTLPASFLLLLRLPLPFHANLVARLRFHSRLESDFAVRQLLSLLQHFSPDGRQWPLPIPAYVTFFNYWPITRLLLRNLSQNYTGFRYAITIDDAGPSSSLTSSSTRSEPPNEEPSSAALPHAPTFTAVFYQNESEVLSSVRLPSGAEALTQFYDACRGLAHMGMADKSLLEVLPGFVVPQSRISGGSRMTYRSLVAALFRQNESYDVRDSPSVSESAIGLSTSSGAVCTLFVKLTPDAVITLAQSNMGDMATDWREELARQFIESFAASLVPVLEAHNTVAHVAAALDAEQGATVQRTHVCLLVDRRNGVGDTAATGDRSVKAESTGASDVSPVAEAKDLASRAGRASTETWCEAILVSRGTAGRTGSDEDESQLLIAAGTNRAEALMALAHKARHLKLAIAAFEGIAAAARSGVSSGPALLIRLQRQLESQMQLKGVHHRYDNTVEPPRLLLVGQQTHCEDKGGEAGKGSTEVVVAKEDACAWSDVPRKLFPMYHRTLSTTLGTPLFMTVNDILDVTYKMKKQQLVDALAEALNRSPHEVHTLINSMTTSSKGTASATHWFGELSLPAELFQLSAAAPPIPSTESLSQPTRLQRASNFMIYTVGNTIREAQRCALVALYLWIVCGDDRPVANVQTVPWTASSPAGTTAGGHRPPSEQGAHPLSASSAMTPVAATASDDSGNSTAHSLLALVLTDLETKLCAVDTPHSVSPEQRGKLTLRLTHVFGASLSYTVAGASATQPRAASPRVKVRRPAVKPAKPVPLGAQAWDPTQLLICQLLAFVVATSAKITFSMSASGHRATRQSHLKDCVRDSAPALRLSRSAMTTWQPLSDTTAMEFSLTFFRRYLGLRVLPPDTLTGTPGSLCLTYDETARGHAHHTARAHTIRLRLRQFSDASDADARAAFSIPLCEVVGSTRESALSQLWTECAQDIRRAFRLHRGASQDEVDSLVFTALGITFE